MVKLSERVIKNISLDELEYAVVNSGKKTRIWETKEWKNARKELITANSVCAWCDSKNDPKNPLCIHHEKEGFQQDYLNLKP